MLSCLKVLTYMAPGLGFSNTDSVKMPAQLFQGPSTWGVWLMVLLGLWKPSVESGLMAVMVLE
jgi:hypothetical protein